MRSGWTLATGCWLVAWAAAAAGPQPHTLTPQEAEFFEQRIRPVLAEHCFRCHGPQKQSSGLRLDSRAALLKGSDNGPVVKPGDPDNSPLVEAVRRSGATKMPPKTPLPPEAVQALTAWVKMGVPWPESAAAATGANAEAARRHWAFQPVRNPVPPAVKDTAWPHTTVDRFILAKLEAKGLTPAPAADRRTLLRRLSFDLTGLPPTPDDSTAFEADTSPDALARVVDRLLASPEYGERWGRYWLDVARYADTKGYVFFEEAQFPWAWTYRDYVVRSFNDDLPYDRFVLEQLAADRLPPGADKRPLTALGFLSLGGRFMNNPHDILDDRIDVVARGLLGLTVTCARCHDHKFDPIPQKDYYSLYGVFASSVEPTVPPLFEEPPRTEAYEKFDRELKAREQKLADFIRAQHDAVVGGARTRAAEYLLAVHARKDQPSADDFMLLADGNDLNPTMIIRWQAYLARTRKQPHPVWAPWHALADLPEKEFADRAAVLCAGLAHADPAHPVNPLVVKALSEKPPRTLAEAARCYAELLNGAEKQWQDAVKHAAEEKAPPATLSDPAEEELRQCFHAPGAAPNVAYGEINDLALFPDRPSQGKLQELRKAVEQWRATGPGAPPRAMVLVDAPVPYEPRVFRRGNPNNPGDAVPRQFLQVLAGPSRQPFRDGSGRLELAQAIVERKNPLTARVLVNRVWLHHFGAGLVRTPSDFGLRSEPPSHPELLDHLATAFMDGGWSIKKLHRLILLSAVYQQRSDDRPECRRVDPDNALLWKMNRRRLDFEALRDALLAVSDRLDRRMGGPPVKDTLGPAGNRRTLYGYLDRLHVPGLWRTFDFPSPDATSPQRDSTTVPQQALFLMNNPFVLESARRLLRRPEVEAEADTARKVERLYRLAYGRAPAAEEVSLARDYLGAANQSAAEWERYVQALLLANEFVFVD
jgi:hypothetical protein